MPTSKRSPSILVGDIGGTRTRLALYDPPGKRLLYEAVRSSREHDTFDEIALAFLAEANVGQPLVAVLGVAGPVQNGTAHVTNLPWQLDEKSLAKRLLIPQVVLKNDLVVAAYGCLHVPPSSVTLLTRARPSPMGNNCAVLAAGTGLGQARLIWDGEKHLALGSEGGHCDFAPRTPLEMELWQFLIARFPDHVSVERVLSGNGIGALYSFFASRARREPRAISRTLAEGDRNAAITELGLSRAYRPAARAIELFASIYGAEAGNLALRELALGGIFVTGNIGRQVLPARREDFMDSFRRKGRFAAMLEKVPVAVVTDPLVGVLGALAVAKGLLAEKTRPSSPKRKAKA